MSVLEKIKKLQQERGWTTDKLAYESGLTQSTLSNMFSKETCPTIDTLQLICDAFGILLSEFFEEVNRKAQFLKKNLNCLENIKH